jgi:hypothetical protein
MDLVNVRDCSTARYDGYGMCLYFMELEYRVNGVVEGFMGWSDPCGWLVHSYRMRTQYNTHLVSSRQNFMCVMLSETRLNCE